jgi:MerR family redox-sensitive transcriptional activator SoxR
MKIGELARAVGMTTTAIRWYEAQGLLPRPRRVSGRREYEADAAGALLLVRAAQAAGFTIAETRTLVREAERERESSATWKRLAKRKLDEVVAARERLAAMEKFLRATLACGCVRASDCELLARAGRERPPSRKLRV